MEKIHSKINMLLQEGAIIKKQNNRTMEKINLKGNGEKHHFATNSPLSFCV